MEHFPNIYAILSPSAPFLCPLFRGRKRWSSWLPSKRECTITSACFRQPEWEFGGAKGCRKRLCRRTKMRKVAWQRGLMEVGRGGACVPARVALQGRIHQQQMCIMRNAQTFLRMETPLSWMGDVPFADGNAAARTFGRAHRHRPYHFSCGSVSQGRRKRLCRWTKTRKGCRKRLCRWTKTRKGCVAEGFDGGW